MRNVTKCLPLARAFTNYEIFVIWVSFSSHAFHYFGLLAFVKGIFLRSKFALFLFFGAMFLAFHPK